MYRNGIKRVLDFLLSLAATILLSPIMLALSIWVKLDSPGPVFFRQKRVGIHKTHFNILKFRTMKSDTPHDVPTHMLKNPDSYITKSGAFLRKTSLDELPQLINVVRGEMSLVGPRPIVEAEIAKYGEVYADYCRVRPGITGLWQVSGRNNTTYEERVNLDRYYVTNWCIWMDLWILARTFPVVLTGYGAY